MQKIAIGVLSVTVLALAAMNARHQDRERLLEERLASAEKKTKRKPAPVEREAAAPVAEPAAPAPVPSAAPAPIETLPLAASIPLITSLSRPAVYTNFVTDSGAFKASFAIAPYDGDLDLTDGQRSAIDRLREIQKSQKEDIERSIRNLLTPDQLAKYDAAQHGGQTLWIGQTEGTVINTGIRPGYLGVQGGDAGGGGAEVTSVLADTAASASGLQTGDVILQVNGEPVAGLSALSQTIRKTGEGFSANLLIRRSGVEFIQGVQLGGASK